MIVAYSVSRDTEYSVAGGTEWSFTLSVDCLAAGGTEGSEAGGGDCPGSAFLVGFACCHPSPIFVLLIICTNGQCGPHEPFSVTFLDITVAWGIATILDGSVLMVGVGVGARAGE